MAVWLATSSGVFFFRNPPTPQYKSSVFSRDYDEIDIGRALVLQRSFDTGEQLHGAEIDVLVELEAEFEEESFFQNAGGDVRMTHRAQVHAVELAQLVDSAGRQNFAGPQIAIAAKIVMHELELEVLERSDSCEHFQPFGCNFGAGAIAADDGDLEMIGSQSGVLKYPVGWIKWRNGHFNSRAGGLTSLSAAAITVSGYSRSRFRGGAS